MQSTPTTVYIGFGTTLRFLQSISPGRPVHGDGQVLENIDSLLKSANDLGLVVTLRTQAARDLIMFRLDLGDRAEDAELSSDEAIKLREIVVDLRTTLWAERSEERRV